METTTDHLINNSTIADLIEIRKKNYLNDSLQIVADYNNENKNIDEYNGRQLLEMIQNANDESDTIKTKKVYLKLDHKSLIIANNGNPFSKGGVESLMYSDLSPKTMEENKVGKKGLGFRSILNWSEEIYIASYDLHLKFSQKIANEFLEELIKIKPEIRTDLIKKTKIKSPISVLRCPHFEINSSKKKADNYDTVIELILKDGVYNTIIKQIQKDVVPEILIFLNKLEEIEVETPDEHFIFRKEFDKNTKQVSIEKEDFNNSENNQQWSWYILEDKGVVENHNEIKNYELKIAYNPNEEFKHHKLYSFFRTEIDFPYPVIAHGSFELKSDRNHLIDDGLSFNKILLHKLAKLMVQCALEITKQGTCSYEGLKLVVPSTENSSGLNAAPWGFNSLLETEIQDSELFPTINNEYTKLTGITKFYTVDITKLIPEKSKNDFTHLLKYTNDIAIRRYFSGITQNLRYEDSVLTKKINLLIENRLLTIDETVEWIYLIHTSHFALFKNSNIELPNLLIDESNKPIRFGSEAITPPEGDNYKMPTHVDISFINQQQYKRLKTVFDNANTRQLVDRLKRYNITEYALNVAVGKIISSTHKLIEKKPLLRGILIKEMHEALYTVYLNIKEDTENKKSIPPNISSPLLFTRENKLKPADRLYFGKEYTKGQLMEGLLGGIVNDVFIGNIELNMFDDLTDKNKIEDYLSWIGVSDLPKREELSLSERNYRTNPFIHSVIKGLKYPYITYIHNDNIQTIEGLNNCWNFSMQALWFNYFEEILTKAPIEYIMTWFIKDQSIHTSLTTNSEGINSELSFSFPNKQYKRKIHHSDLRSYILYKTQDIPFIPVENGEKVVVGDCLLDGTNLKPLLKTPIINYGAKIFIDNRIDKEQIDYLLKRLGVKDSLKDVSLNKLYGYLLKHHQFYENNHKNIQNFYIALIEATKSKVNFRSDLPNRSKYLNEGKIFVEKNGQSSFENIKNATYVDNPNFSQDLLKNLYRAKLPTRAGNLRMKSLFGVQPLDYIKFNVADNVQSNDKINQQFIDELNNLKPYLFMYRFNKALAKSQEDAELLSLKKLKVKTCNDINISYCLSGQKHILNLNDYEYIQDHESSIFYVKIPQYMNEYVELKNDFRFKETVSDIICGALKVTENRKDFMLLLGEHGNNRDKVLEREFENFNVLQREINQRFDGALTAEQKFWATLYNSADLKWELKDIESVDAIYSKIVNIDINKDDFFNLIRDFDFNDISSFKNIKLLQVLFNTLNIDVFDFNKQSYKSINLTSYWNNMIHTLHKEFVLKTKSYYFKLEDKEKFKINTTKIERLQSFGVDNSICFDYKGAFKLKVLSHIEESVYEEILLTDIVDFKELFSKNLKGIKNELKSVPGYNESVVSECMYDDDFKINVIFNEIDKIKDFLKTLFKENPYEDDEISFGDKKISSEDTEKLLETIEDEFNQKDYKLEEYDMHTVDKRIRGNGNNGENQSKFSSNKGINNKDIGFIGEKFAFEILKKEFDSVQWVSEYALRAGFPEGTDGLGYDFECRINNETRFIEVKASKINNLSFKITENEIREGHAKHNVYDILLITNVLSHNREFKYLKNIFHYKENESFVENSKFTVENESYQIRFK